MTNKNIGIFEIYEGMIRNEPERVAEVFAFMKLVPVRAEMLFAHRVIEYTGLSVVFPELANTNCKIPKYELKIRRSEAGDIEGIEAVLL